MANASVECCCREHFSRVGNRTFKGGRSDVYRRYIADRKGQFADANGRSADEDGPVADEAGEFANEDGHRAVEVGNDSLEVERR